MKTEISNMDWVFWIQIEKRDWFKRFWKSRGANSLTVHFFKWHISIGMPWLQNAVNESSLESINETNRMNLEGVKNHGRFRIVKQNI